MVVLMPSKGDGGAASLQLLRALINASPEAQEQAADVGCDVRASGGVQRQQRANIAWREGAQLRSTPSPYPHLAAILEVRPSQTS